MIFPVQIVSLMFPEEIILSNGEPYYLNVSILIMHLFILYAIFFESIRHGPWLVERHERLALEFDSKAFAPVSNLFASFHCHSVHRSILVYESSVQGLHKAQIITLSPSNPS